MRPEDLLFRTGGDEFAVLLADRVDLTTVRAQAGYFGETLLAPFDLDQITVQVDAGVGIALYPDHCADPQQLLKPRGGGGVARQGRRQQDRGVQRGGGDTKR